MERIIVSKGKKGANLELEIFPEKDKNKMRLLSVWLILWTLGGLIVASQLFEDHDKNIKLFIVVWLAFFLYFEYKVLYVRRWRLSGSEKVIIANKELKIVKNVKGRGLEHVYIIDKIKELNLTQTERKSLTNVLGNSFWVIGNESIQFEYEGRKIAFGYQLSDKLATKIINLLSQEINKQKRAY